MPKQSEQRTDAGYFVVLDNQVADLIDVLRTEAERRNIVLLDYGTNADVGDVSRPLSHASLVASYVAGNWQRRRDLGKRWT